MRWLLLLFVVVPLIELYLLLFVGSQIGFWPTVAIVLVTGVIGATLAKREGLRVWGTYREALAQGRLPDEGIVGGLLVLVGGVLLVTPGMLTDFLGFCLLLPQTRKFVADRIRAVIAAKLDKGVVQVMSVSPGMGPMDADFGAARSMHDPFEEVFTRPGRYDRGDVVDTVGEEVHQGLLLGPGELPQEPKETGEQ